MRVIYTYAAQSVDSFLVAYSECVQVILSKCHDQTCDTQHYALSTCKLGHRRYVKQAYKVRVVHN